ncbi:MAG: serine dehydratase beta chain, partial [Janthinobacterium lividum]
MALSVFDMFSIGIGPSSSHTVGPMRAALAFVRGLADDETLERVAAVTVDLYGSLGATGRGHGSDRAVVLGLAGERPESTDPDALEGMLDVVRTTHRLALLATHDIGFDLDTDVRLIGGTSLPAHPNGMVFTARDADGEIVAERTSYSVGGGFVREHPLDDEPVVAGGPVLPYPFRTGGELLEHCRGTGLSVGELVRRNEESLRPRTEVDARLLEVFAAMAACVEHGLVTDGTLPGGLGVRRRAPRLHRQLLAEDEDLLANPEGPVDVLGAMDWVSLFALAVNEENAAGGRVVTAPT